MCDIGLCYSVIYPPSMLQSHDVPSSTKLLGNPKSKQSSTKFLRALVYTSPYDLDSVIIWKILDKM